MIRAQPPGLKNLTGISIQTARHEPIVRAHPGQHSYAEPSLGPPHILWLYRPGPPCRQPTFTCERRPQPPYHLAVDVGDVLAHWPVSTR